ncbi:MAG: hypothetical protein WCC89_14005 [Candidatus Sulfotelmatobacter sp.]
MAAPNIPGEALIIALAFVVAVSEPGCRNEQQKEADPRRHSADLLRPPA